ncbi:uncharacterized protein LOC101708617 isoform X1 [Heterocephalus glaber]|uniref:Cytochrome b-c1 complex subunit 9 n=1 Tax=Heterocephalus glaber TaxID=10181 RepID=A0AAX6QWD4_HETGA|nr:uncharacterized protein LOC101708617 isoform X1 [Heterocephalus glaber]
MAGPTIVSSLYSLLFRRTSTFALTIAVGAVFFERAFDQGADAIYEHVNDGVRAWAILTLGFLKMTEWKSCGNISSTSMRTRSSSLPPGGQKDQVYLLAVCEEPVGSA